MDDIAKKRDEAPEAAALTRRGFLGMAASVTAAATAAVLPKVASAATAASDERDVLEVAIIGAGLAGLTAARDLKRAGCESFVVLEARDRVGGRTLNHDLGKGYFSESGGQWIGPGQTAVADLARELGVGTFPTYWQGKTVMLAGGAEALLTFGTIKAWEALRTLAAEDPENPAASCKPFCAVKSTRSKSSPAVAKSRNFS